MKTINIAIHKDDLHVLSVTHLSHVAHLFKNINIMFTVFLLPQLLVGRKQITTVCQLIRPHNNYCVVCGIALPPPPVNKFNF